MIVGVEQASDAAPVEVRTDDDDRPTLALVDSSRRWGRDEFELPRGQRKTATVSFVAQPPLGPDNLSESPTQQGVDKARDFRNTHRRRQGRARLRATS